ncbi:MAG TPA: transcription termination factor NusA [Phycisphaerae bacterium]|nr:transcription termination factor NusA [Phycisphaerae bacterium]HRW51827.1 transcription termination factor NusA [Phycisphaerae bacterium]
MSSDLLRIVDGLARDKNIDKDMVLGDLETAMETAIRKKYPDVEEVTVEIDRLTGEIGATADDRVISMAELGRIAAQTAKQVMIQRIREAERGSIFEEFIERKGTIVTGTVARFEGGAMLVSLGRTDGFLPRSEQIPGETHQAGERIRTLILDVREAPHQVKIILSRSHPDFIRRLFELEVPEVAERIIEIKALAREAGYRTKLAVSSIDTKVDAVGACVGVRGSRIKNIVEELGGEKIDIVRWNESSQILIANALKPAEIQDTALCFELGRATVVVPEDQLSLAIGKRGQNVRLAARLTGWDIDILTPTEFNKGLDRLAATLQKVEGMEDVITERISLMGLINVLDVDEVGADPLVRELGLEEALAKRIVEACTAEAKVVQAEQAAQKAADELAKAEAAQRKAAGIPAESESLETLESPTGEGAEAMVSEESAPSSDDGAAADEASTSDEMMTADDSVGAETASVEEAPAETKVNE